MYNKTIQKIELFFNAYPLKEFIMRFKYHKFTISRLKHPILISMIDGRRKTQGFTDRLNGIISIFALAKATNTIFRIVYTNPFPLSDFLIPNRYNWIPSENEISNSVKDVYVKILRKQPTLKRLLRLFPLQKQVEIYANLNYLDEVNSRFQQHYIWGELFDELFKPTKILENEIEKHLKKIGKNYIACVFRFQSLLDDFTEYNYKPLPVEKQKVLIEKNKNALIQIIEKNECPVLVTSDSIKFISSIDGLKNVYILPGKVVHLDCSLEEQSEVYMKSFVDFLMISYADKVYSIGTKKMYPTSFPMYAAKIHNVPFERILVE